MNTGLPPFTDPPPKDPPPPGLICPRCGCGHFWVLYTRLRPRRIMRRRECRHCGRTIVTYESIVGGS
jgi:hypothetical protein